MELGIGLACALMLAKNGADSVYLVDIKEIETIVAQKKIEQYCPCLSIFQDITDEAGVDSVFDTVSQNGHTIDVLVCAGFARRSVSSAASSGVCPPPTAARASVSCGAC